MASIIRKGAYKGDKTPGVQRQHCGAVGKQENCMVTVHLGYAAQQFHCLLDGELFLPESWWEKNLQFWADQPSDEIDERPDMLPVVSGMTNQFGLITASLRFRHRSIAPFRQVEE